jgi:Fe-S cluster biogenesis protein NfuA
MSEARVQNPENGAWKARGSEENGTMIEAADPLFARVDAALEEVRPGILADGGDVWLIRIDAGVAYVQMLGACGGCAAANATLKFAIERIVRERCPEIERVEQI